MPQPELRSISTKEETVLLPISRHAAETANETNQIIQSRYVDTRNMHQGSGLMHQLDRYLPVKVLDVDPALLPKPSRWELYSYLRSIIHLRSFPTISKGSYSHVPVIPGAHASNRHGPFRQAEEFPPQEQGARLRRLVLYLADRAGPTEIGKVREAPAAEFFWSATGMKQKNCISCLNSVQRLMRPKRPAPG